MDDIPKTIVEKAPPKASAGAVAKASGISSAGGRSTVGASGVYPVSHTGGQASRAVAQTSAPEAEAAQTIGT